MNYLYKTRGTCSAEIRFAIAEDDTLEGVEFRGGCDGNLQGISRLIVGMDAKEAISRMEGIRCGFKATSCPDQLAQALKEAVGK